MFEGMTNPTPYIAASYMLGALLIFGYSIYLLKQNKDLKQLLAVVSKGKGKHGN